MSHGSVNDPHDYWAEFDAQSGSTEAKDEWLARRSRNYEERMVKRLLRYSGNKLTDAEATRRCEEFSGERVLTFAWLHTELPGLPLWLGARFIPYVHELTLRDLKTRFTRTSIYKVWEELKESVPDAWVDNPLGLVFHWPDVGDVIFHDLSSLDVEGFRICWKQRNDYVLTLDMFDTNTKAGFLPALTSRWVH